MTLTERQLPDEHPSRAAPYALQLHAAHRARHARFTAMAIRPALPAPVVEAEPAITSRSFEEAHSIIEAMADPLAAQIAQVRELFRELNVTRGIVHIRSIQSAVASRYAVPIIDILSARRTASVVLPRQIAMYLAKTLTTRSLPEIGRLFGGRDHTTVLHSFRKMSDRIARDTDFAAEVQSLIDQIECAR